MRWFGQWLGQWQWQCAVWEGRAYDGCDGWCDIAAAQNNEQLRVFRNGGRPRRKPLAIRLEGGRGNPAGIGARVQLRPGDGRAATAVGAIIALSSTACVLGVLMDRAELDSIHGRNATAI